MKKRILLVCVAMFLVSFLAVSVLGRKAYIKYETNDVNNISIRYNKDIIKCKEYRKKDKIEIIVSPIKKGKTEIVLTNNKKIEYKRIVYVHNSKVITLDNYFGKCNGDSIFILSYLIFLLILLFNIKKAFITGIRKNLYNYGNARLLGLILFVTIILLLNLYTFVIDSLNNYHESLYIFVSNVIDSSAVFIVLMLPVTIIVSLLVCISNIKLILKEGKTWKNMLGIILGGFIFIASIAAILINSSAYFLNSRTLYIILSFLSYTVAIIVAYLECILFGTIILSIIASKRKVSFDKDYIIILGCKIKEDGTLYPLLKSRVDKALEFAKLQKQNTGKDIIFVPSGGKGNDEIISEAEAMKNYLIKQGISKKKILVEDKSNNTYENIKNSYELIKKQKKKGNILFCTTNYHVFRTGEIASSQKIYLKGIGAKTKTYFWINAFIREFVATLSREKEKHIKTIIILVLLSFSLLIVHYLSLYS